MTGLLWWTLDTTLASQGRMIDYPVMNYLPVAQQVGVGGRYAGNSMKEMCPVN